MPANKYSQRLQRGSDYRDRAAVLAHLGYRSYRGYLDSYLWATIRARVMKEKGPECYLCTGRATEVHHNRYGLDDMMGIKVDNLFPLCRACHRAIEFTGDRKNTMKKVRKRFQELTKKKVEDYPRLWPKFDWNSLKILPWPR